MAILSSDQVKMTSLLERLISIIAPHRCIACGNYNNVLCNSCVANLLPLRESFCVRCAKPTSFWRLCVVCTKTTSLTGVWPAVRYNGAVAKLVKQYKFSHNRAACRPLADILTAALPSLDPTWCVVPVPTVSSHIRQRGYDHAVVLARQVSRYTQLPLVRAVRRTGNERQVGATRAVRLQQAGQAFESAGNVAGRRVVIIDDVCTTGATLSAVADVLVSAGALEVWGAVVAWQPPSDKKDPPHPKRNGGRR